MVSLSTITLRAAIACSILLRAAEAGYAPKEKPKLPAGFCPKGTGTVTDTTGECMCHWQHRDGCVGSECQYEMGLSWYHYSCADCKCVAEPST